MSGAGNYEVYIQPLANAAGDYQDEVRVDHLVTNNLRVGQRLAKSKWSVGQLIPSLDTIELANNDARFSAASDPRSIFAAAGADRARVRILEPDLGGQTDEQRLIYRGQITTKTSSVVGTTGKAVWSMRTPDIAFVDQVLNPGLITSGMTIRQAIEACFNDRQIAAAIPNLYLDGFFDPNPGGTIINDENQLLGDDRRADRVMEKLLLAVDGLLSYWPAGEQARYFRRGELRNDRRGAVPWSSGLVFEPLEIVNISDGAEQVYNVITAATGIGTDGVLEVSDPGSISRWGRRELSLDLTWIVDLDQIDRVIKNLLARLSRPQRYMQVVVPSTTLFDYPGFGEALQVYGASAIAGGLVGVELKAKAPRGSARYGTARYGTARYARTLWSRTIGNFYIEEIERRLKGGTTKLSLREFID